MADNEQASNEAYTSDQANNKGAEPLGVPAKIMPGRRVSSIWIVPIVALLVGVYMVFSHWSNQGPVIEISFESADGIEPGKTKVKRHNVDLGEALAVRMSADASQVILSVRIDKQYAKLLREDTTFWVVRPRIGKDGVTGLDTLLSGAYIELAPGVAEKRSRTFIGLEKPPVTPLGTPGLHVTLESDSENALHEGDPILFHGRSVGTIEYVHFNSEERRTYYNAFIRAPYDALITSNTRFWFSSGISVDLSADGVQIQTGTLQSIIAGGVAFDVPKNLPRGELITERAFFPIYANQTAINEPQYRQSVPYMVLFDDSIRGLSQGAPVEYRGIKIGTVVRTDFDYDEAGKLLEPGSFIPVQIALEPARLGYADSGDAIDAVKAQVQRLIAGGLSASLASGNVLTGSQYIALEHKDVIDTAADSLPLNFHGYAVIPSTEGQLGQLMVRVEQVLEKINKLPLGDVADSARTAMDEASTTLTELRKSADALAVIMESPDTQDVVANLNATLSSLQVLAEDFSADSQTHQNLQGTLRSLDDVLQQLQPVLQTLKKKPNSLIFGGAKRADKEPKAAK